MSVYISYAIMNFYVFALIQTKGKAILVFLYDMDIDIDSRIEKNIAIKGIIVQIIFTLFIGSLPFYLCDILIFGIQNVIFKKLTDLFENVIILSNYFCLLSMMTYFCYVIQQNLIDLQKEFISHNQLLGIFKKLLVIQNNVKKFDQFYNKYLFCIIVLCSVECVSSLTILYFHRCKTMPWVLAAIFESILQILIYCYLSDRIYNSYMNIINKYEQLQLEIHETNIGHLNHCLVSRLYSLTICVYLYLIYIQSI